MNVSDIQQRLNTTNKSLSNLTASIMKDSVFLSFKSSVDLVLQQLLRRMNKSDLSTVESFIEEFITNKLEVRTKKSNTINEKLNEDTIDSKNGALSCIQKLSLEDIGNRAEAVTYNRYLYSAKKQIESLLVDIENYIRVTYQSSLSLLSTQTDRSAFVDLIFVRERSFKEKLDLLINYIFMYISDIDKSVEIIRNSNKTTELLLRN